MRKYHGLDHAFDRPVHGVESRFSYSPLLCHEYRPVSKFRANSTKGLTIKNKFPSFEDTEHNKPARRVYPNQGDKKDLLCLYLYCRI